jgi:polysaccharide pyruvyl transferase WcaK-like protein
MKIVVINQCSTNKGDRAVLYFVIRELLRNGISDVTISTSDTSYWQGSSEFPGEKIRYIPFGWNSSLSRSAGFTAKVFRRLRYYKQRDLNYPLLRNAFIKNRRPWYLPFICGSEFLRAIETADLVISTGGHHVTTIIAADAVYAQTFDMAVALMLNKPLVLWSQSIGPFVFKSQLNKAMVQKILVQADRIYIRNTESADQIRLLGISMDHVTETYESVFGLYDIVENRTMPSQRAAVLGISIYAANRRTLGDYRYYVDQMSILVRHAISCGYKVRFYPMELSGADRKCINDIIEQAGDCEVMNFPPTPDHLNSIAACKMFVGHKTHSVIFSLVAQTPLLAIAYHKKTQDFLAQFRLSDYCVEDKKDFTGSKLIELFDKINANLDTISMIEQECASKICSQVQNEFKSMLTDFKR